MKEFNNREIANKHAEYITSEELRRYTAEKVKKYVPNVKTIFDGAVGSGQLEEFLEVEEVTGVEIQEGAANAFLENYPKGKVFNKSFFLHDEYIEHDASVINPPYSLKFKERTDEEKEAIKKEFPWKKSGVVDDIFLLKSLNFTKRYAFYIMFPGIAYRKTEKKLREIVGNKLVELNSIENGFKDTTIEVLFIIIDKKKTDNKCYGEVYDCSTKEIKAREENEIDIDSWQIPRVFEKEKEIDIVAVEADLKATRKRIKELTEQIEKLLDEEIRPLIFGDDFKKNDEQISMF